MFQGNNGPHFVAQPQPAESTGNETQTAQPAPQPVAKDKPKRKPVRASKAVGNAARSASGQ